MGILDIWDTKKKESNKTQKKYLSVNDTKNIERNLKVMTQNDVVEMQFFCSIRNATIYCHSILLDKLGDLTKFIILSLYEQHSVDEICALTQMNKTTINEELEYLIRGRLINDDRQTLTELGEQYGLLIKKFAELSKGIDIAYNVFAERFEIIEGDKCISTPDPKYVLKGHFIPALTRNDNYANSLEIAKKLIEKDTPFCMEIRNSLYTTVKIGKDESRYKSVYVRDFSKGYSSENGSCVKIAIPFEVITYKPRYRRVDKYRDIIKQLFEIKEEYEELLSDKAKHLISSFNEENEAEAITISVNTISGKIVRLKDELGKEPNDPSVYVVGNQPIQIQLDEDACKGIYLQEINREQLYKIRYFPYGRMEE